MEGHDVGARLGETRYVTLRLDDHQVHVEALCGHLADGLQHRKPEGDIGDEHAVHHVDMYPLGRTAVDHLRVAFQVAEIGRKHRRCYDSVHGSNITYDKYSHFPAVFHASERDSVPANPGLGFGVAVRDSECRFPVARSFRGFRPERAAGQDLFRFRVSILRRIAMPLDSESSNASPMPHTHVTPTPAGRTPPAMLPVRAGTTYAPATTKPRPRRGRPG